MVTVKSISGSDDIVVDQTAGALLLYFADKDCVGANLARLLVNPSNNLRFFRNATGKVYGTDVACAIVRRLDEYSDRALRVFRNFTRVSGGYRHVLTRNLLRLSNWTGWRATRNEDAHERKQP
jgi:hypothetical protein